MPFADTLAVLSTEPEHSLGIWVISLQNINIVWLQSQDSVLDITLCSSVKEGRKKPLKYASFWMPMEIVHKDIGSSKLPDLFPFESSVSSSVCIWSKCRVCSSVSIDKGDEANQSLYTSTFHCGADDILHPFGTAEFMENIDLTHDRKTRF